MTATMHRTMASHNIDAACYDYNDFTHLPPWETEGLAQVPYLDGTSAALSEAEREGLPALWAAQTNTARAARPRLNAETQDLRNGGSHHDIRSAESRISGSSGNSWGVATPLSAPPQPPAAQYTPVYIPPAPKTEPNLPSFVMTHPPSPEQRGSTSTASTPSTPRCRCQCQHDMSALPGTVTDHGGYDATPSRRRAGSKAQSNKSNRMGRLRIVLKGLFKGQPVDESQLERIEDQHWAGEY